MVSRLDIVFSVGLFPGLSAASLSKKMGKKPVSYVSVFQALKKLEQEGLIQKKNDLYYLAGTSQAKSLFWLLTYCSKNNLDYNAVVSERTAEFVRIGLEKGAIKGLPFDAKTVRKIVLVLSKNGFAIIESKKPFVCRIVYSAFLEKLVEYFGKKPKILCKELVEELDKKRLDSALEKEFSSYKRASKGRMVFDETGFIYTSLSLEGNTLTFPETEKVIKQNIPPASKSFKDAQEILDYKKALDNFAFTNLKPTLENVLDFHRTAMNSMQAGAGQVRQQNVRIKGNPDFKTPDWHEVPGLLGVFFEKIAEFEQQKKLSASQMVEQASFLHSEFQRIHPFVDGNSRTARAIFIKALLEKGFPLVKIPIGFFDQYMKLTKLSEKRDDLKFAVLMKQIVLENLKQARQKIEYAE